MCCENSVKKTQPRGVFVIFVFNICLCVFNRRKSKQALRDYKKVQIQLENLETSVRDRCKKEFTGQTLPHKHQPDSADMLEMPHDKLCVCIMCRSDD